MDVRVSKESADWLKEQVASGKYASIEEALDAAMGALKAELTLDDEWIRPLIIEALAALDSGEGAVWSLDHALRELHQRHSDTLPETFYDRMTPEQRAHLAEGTAQADRGEGGDASVVFDRLSKRLGLGSA